MKAFLPVAFVGLFCLKVSFAQLEYIGPEGGYIQCMVTDIQGNILAGFRFGGIYKTTDFGENWSQIFDGYRNLDVRSLAVNLDNDYFAGTDGAGFFRSTDEGVSWEKINNILSTLTIQVLLITPSSDIYAGTFSGVYKSTDNGTTFLPVGSGIPTSSISSLALVDNTLLVGTYYQGIYMSTDGGNTWQAANDGLEYNGRLVESIAVTDEGVLAGVGTWPVAVSMGDKVFIAYNLLERVLITWSGTSVPPKNVHQLKITNIRNESSLGGATNSNGGGLISLPLNNINGGWTTENAPQYSMVEFIRAGLNFMVGYAGRGAYASLDGLSTFVQRNNNMKASSVVKVKNVNEYLIAVTESGQVFGSIDGGDNLLDITYNLPEGYIYDVAINPVTSYRVVSTVNSTYGLAEGGNQWQDLGFLSRVVDYNYAGILFYGYGDSFGFSNDDGATTFSLHISGISNIRNFAFINDQVFISTASESGSSGNGVWTSSPPYVGATQDGLDGLPVTFVDALDNSTSISDCLGSLAAGTYNGQVFFRDENGQYSEHSDGLDPSDHISAISSIKTSGSTEPNIEFVHNEVSFYTSLPGQPNSCRSETLFEITGDVAIRCSEMANSQNFASRSGNILPGWFAYYGSLGTGILRRDLLSDVEIISSDIPESYSLEQNYPNPFNPSTTIQFSIPEQSFVNLEVFNTLGEKVTTLVSEELNAGNYKYEWDAENLTSGIYFYKLSSDNFSEIKKMIFLK